MPAGEESVTTGVNEKVVGVPAVTPDTVAALVEDPPPVLPESPPLLPDEVDVLVTTMYLVRVSVFMPEVLVTASETV
jgi:hypothetical protein